MNTGVEFKQLPSWFAEWSASAAKRKDGKTCLAETTALQGGRWVTDGVIALRIDGDASEQFDGASSLFAYSLARAEFTCTLGKVVISPHKDADPLDYGCEVSDYYIEVIAENGKRGHLAMRYAALITHLYGDVEWRWFGEFEEPVIAYNKTGPVAFLMGCRNI